MQMAELSYDLPDSRGHFGPYGGVFVAETLIRALDELRDQYARYRRDPEFVAEFEYELAHYVGRPSPVYHAKRWSEQVGGAQIWLKREDLNHTGAHKINNCIGQALLAKRHGQEARDRRDRRRPARRGDAQPSRRRFGMECVVYMGAEDIQAAGAERVPDEAARRDGGPGRVRIEDAEGCAERGDARLGDQRRDTFYIIGTVAGPHPYPMMVRDFQSVIGRECLVQMPRVRGTPARCDRSPAWAAAPTRWASSIRTFRTPASG